MKFMRGCQIRAMLSLGAVLLLTGCGNIPFLSKLQQPQQQQFHPLDSEVAQMAAPEGPAPANQLYCRIGRGDAHFGKAWSPYTDAVFRLAPGARVTVPLARKKGVENVDIMGFFDAEGQKLIFCPVVEGPPDKRVACTSLYALDEDLNAGIKRTFDVPAAIRGGEITCAYEEKKLQKI